MQTAGMLRGTRAIRFFALLLSLIGCAHSYPLQILPSIPGYIPVYIRHGDEPLENINPALAEAFHETPSSKSIRVETLPDAPGVNEEDENSLLDKSKQQDVYPARAGPTEGSKSNLGLEEKKKERKPVDKVPVHDVPKVVPVHELRGGSHRDHSRRKPAPLLKESTAKLSPLSITEKEDLQKLVVQVKKKETSLNDLEETVDSELADQPTDLLGEDPRTRDTDKELPIKELLPAGMYANVHKLSPLPTSNDESAKPSKESGTSASAVPEKDKESLKHEEPTNFPTNFHILPTISIPEDNQSESSENSAADEEPPLKVSHPKNLPSNVLKLSPISPPEESSKTSAEPSILASPKTENQQAPSKEEESANVATNIHILPTASIPDDTKSSADETDSSPADDEPPVKVPHPDKVLSNVVKLAPIAPPEGSSGSPVDKTTAREESPVTEKKELAKDETPMKMPTYIHILPTIPVPEEDPQRSKEEDEDSAGDDEPPVKMVHPAGTTSNVHKLSPVDLPKDTAARESMSKEEIVESRQDDKMKDLTQRNDDIAVD